MIVIAVVAVAAAVLIPLLLKRHSAGIAAIYAFVLLALLVPNFGPDGTIRATAASGGLLTATIGLLRTGPVASRSSAKWVTIFVIGSALLSFRGAGAEAILLQAVTAAAFVVFAVLVRRVVVREGMRFVGPLLSTVVLAELILSASEILLGLHALWPRPDGSDVLRNRPNHLFPALPGRALGSVAGPIPLGFLGVVALIVALWAIRALHRPSYWLVVSASLLLIAFSGTRSAAAAAVVVLVLWMLADRGPMRYPVRTLAVLIGLPALIWLNPIALLGFENVGDSISFTHRLRVIDSVQYLLFGRGPGAAVFGAGSQATELLRPGQPLWTGTGVEVFDNQVVRTLAVGGLLGAALLLMVLVQAIRASDTVGRLALLAVLIMSFSFDSLTWNVVMAIFVLFAAGGPAARARDVFPVNESLVAQSKQGAIN